MERDSPKDILHIFYKRYELFNCLCEGNLDKQTVEARIDSLRPTIDRAYRELEERGILSSSGTSYQLTQFGELCCEELARIDERLGLITEIQDLLAFLPREEGFTMELFDGADIHHAPEHAPQEPFTNIVEVATGASEIAGYSSSIMPHYVDAFHTLIVDAATPATLVFTEDVVETGYANYTEKFTEIVDADHTTVYATPQVYTYGVVIADGTVAIPVGDSRDRLRAVIQNDTDPAVAWARGFLDRLIAADGTREV